MPLKACKPTPLRDLFWASGNACGCSSGAPSTRAPAVHDVRAATAPRTKPHVAPSKPHTHSSAPATASPTGSCPRTSARRFPAA
eukprot:2573174-Rhodomonas_salina.1